MEAQAIELTGGCQLFFGPKREAVAHAANLKCVISGWGVSCHSLSLCWLPRLLSGPAGMKQ